MLAVLVNDADPDHPLAYRGAREGLAEDVVGEPEQDEQPERAARDVHSRVDGTLRLLDVAAAGHQPDHDRERQEDDERIERQRDESPRKAGAWKRGRWPFPR